MKLVARSFYTSLIAALIVIAGMAAGADAATFTVTNTNNTGAGSLRQAVLDANAAASADTIVFDASFAVPRTISLATLIAISPATSVDTLTITGPGSNLLTVNASGTDRVFTNGFTNGTNTDTLTISGMTITRTGTVLSDTAVIQNAAILNASDLVISSITGGAIDNTNNTSRSSLSVANCVFNSNSNTFGGAAINNNGTATVTNSTFNANTSGAGGAISNAFTLTVTGSTFTNNIVGSASATGLGGGAIYSSADITAANVTISNSTFMGNREGGNSGGGGAVRNRAGSMFINNSTFAGNSAIAGGGAVANAETLNISGCTFANNTTSGPNAQQSGQGSGGAISSQFGGRVTIADSVLTGNSAANYGGAIYYQPNSPATALLSITNSTVSNNTANSDSDTTGDGGGIYMVGGGPASTITGSTISGNTANAGPTGLSGNAGGIWSEVVINMTNSTVSGNVAQRNYGGIYMYNTNGGTSSFTSSTIVANRAAGPYGGLTFSNSFSNVTVTLRNSIFANNTDNGTAPDLAGLFGSTFNSQGYNLIRSTTGATLTGTTTGNITGQDPVLGPLEDNGGPTFTHAPLLNSPAVDKGNSFGVSTDQRLLTRPFDYPGITSAAGGDASDIGAVEMRPTAQLSGRVSTPSGQGLRNAVVILTDSLGNRTSATTSSFGLFTFSNVPTGTGVAYTITVASKRYRFAPRQINVNGDRTNIDVLGLE